MMIGGIELTGDQTRNKAAERRADLVAAGREPLAGEQHDAGLDPGQRGRKLDVIHVAVFAVAALFNGIVSPRDAEQVQRVDVPKADAGQLILNLFGDLFGILHLRKGRNDDVLLACARNRALQIVEIHGQIDHLYSPLFLMISQQNAVFILHLSYTVSFGL